MKLLRALPLLLLWLSLPGNGALAQTGTPGRAAGNQAPGLRHARLYAIASSRTLNHVNHNDARAALKVWFDIVGQQKGFILDSKVDIVDKVSEIRERLRSHSVDVILMDITDYFELESSRLMVPVMTDARGARGEAPYAYVLMVNPSSGATTIAGLRGKHIGVSSRGGEMTATAWLDILLGTEKLGRSTSFFASIKAVDKPQACILPVFFGAVDACVVDEVNLNLAKEMNPQLGRLRLLARSRPMIESVIAMPVEPHPYQKELLDAMLSLHEDPRGRQLLMVLRTDRLVRIQLGDFDSARELWRDYSRLPAARPYRTAGSGPAAESRPADRGQERY